MKQCVLSENIRQLADANGIDVLGFAKASEFPDYAIRNSKRRDPRLSLTDAKTIIAAGIYIGGLTLPAWATPSCGRTSRLFLSGFWADVVTPLEPIAALLRQEGYRAMICDSSGADGSILPLKLAAIRAGLGWQGKHSLLISKTYGTFLALGGIVTNAELEQNTAEERDRCLTCNKCQQACPLGALDQAYVLQKQQCLSYLLQTDNMPKDAQAAMGNRVMDCEICQDVCPWNTKHLAAPLPTKRATSFQAKIPAWEEFFSFSNLVTLTEQDYHETIGPLNTTIPYTIFRRNVMLAMER